MSYNKLFDACTKRFKDLSKSAVQTRCNDIWKELKAANKKTDLENAVKIKIEELLSAATKEKARLFNYFVQVSQRHRFGSRGFTTLIEVTGYKSFV